jgi:hypothetical protein
MLGLGSGQLKVNKSITVFIKVPFSISALDG